jgi:transposase
LQASGGLKKLVTDELWAAVEPLLPKRRPSPRGGRLWVPYRAALTGIIFVRKARIAWKLLPQEMAAARA